MSFINKTSKEVDFSVLLSFLHLGMTRAIKLLADLKTAKMAQLGLHVWGLP